MQHADTIFIALTDEGTECWRPVQAEHLGNDLYRIFDEKPAGEVWAFGAGDIVRCKTHEFQDGSTGMIACEKASAPFN